MYRLIIKSAFSSLLRRKTRTILVIFMISIALWGLFFMQGIYDGMIQQMINNAIRSDSSHISLFAKDYRAQKDIKLEIKNQKQIDELLDSDKNVKSHISRVLSDALVATARYSKNAFVYGVDLNKEKTHAQLDKYLKEGSYEFGEKANGAIIGFQLARKLKVGIGKKIILSAQNSSNEVSSISLKIKGIIKTNNMSLDESAVFIDIKKAQSFLDIKGVTQIALILKDYSKQTIIKEKLQTDFKNIEVYNWGELYPALLQTQDMMVTFNYISYIIIFCTATIGIFGVILVSVLERIREFGILRAIGTKFRTIAVMILIESSFIGFIGFILGTIFGVSTLYYFKIYGLDLSAFSSALDEFGMDAITYAVLKPDYFFTGFIAVFCATFLSILIPLRVLKKSKPIEVIHG